MTTEIKLPEGVKESDLKNSGEVEANQIRDRISTRRAQGVMRRSRFPW